MDDDQEAETDIREECRICREEADEGDMIAPCLCAGTIKWVHPDCLRQWIAWEHHTNGSVNSRCGVCGSEYQCMRIPSLWDYLGAQRRRFHWPSWHTVAHASRRLSLHIWRDESLHCCTARLGLGVLLLQACINEGRLLMYLSFLAMKWALLVDELLDGYFIPGVLRSSFYAVLPPLSVVKPMTVGFDALGRMDAATARSSGSDARADMSFQTLQAAVANQTAALWNDLGDNLLYPHMGMVQWEQLNANSLMMGLLALQVNWLLLRQLWPEVHMVMPAMELPMVQDWLHMFNLLTVGPACGYMARVVLAFVGVMPLHAHSVDFRGGSGLALHCFLSAGTMGIASAIYEIAMLCHKDFCTWQWKHCTIATD